MNTIIFEGIVGSTVHGTAVNDGLEDLDLMAVVVEDHETFAGFSPKDTWVERTKPEGVRSEAGDVDRVLYGLRKYLHLALKGNPSILLALFVPADKTHRITTAGLELQALAPHIVSKKVHAPFKGYMTQQYERLKGTRGQKNCTRPELVEKYGFDCYLADTEFLTRTGWCTYDEIDQESLGTINPKTGEVEFQQFTERVKKQYTGQIFKSETRYSHWAVTANHRMFVSKVERGPSGINSNDFNPDTANWEFKRADQVASKMWHQRVAGTRRSKEYPINDAFLELMGAYVSEGSIGKKLTSEAASVLRFEQKDGGRLHAVMDRISAVYPTRVYRYPERDDVTLWTLADRDAATRIVMNCGEGSNYKSLPSWTLDLSGRQADVLLNALLAGDGAPYRTGGWVYYTISKNLADMVQAVAITAGRRSVVWGPYKNREHSCMYQVFIQDEGKTILPFSGPNVLFEDVEDCDVVCFTVPNETLITRRHGRVAMHGNTKYAGHIIRLGIQGFELLSTGRLNLPMLEPARQMCIDVRTGKYSFAEVEDLMKSALMTLDIAYEHSCLPDSPDLERVEAWMLETYMRHWRMESYD